MSPTTAQKLRVRENQRRSRARRQQYTQQLEARLRTLEHEGIGVTVQVQAAARKVARENTLLRSFLAYRGIPHSEFAEFAEYARNQNEDGSDFQGINLDSRFQTLHPTAQIVREIRRDSSVRDTPLVRCERSVSPFNQTSQQYTEGQPQSRFSIATVETSGEKQGEEMSNTIFTSDPGISSGSVEITNDSLSQINPKNPSQMIDLEGENGSFSREDVTSCIVAANIIAGMRGRPDIEEVQAELGCETTQNCVISNIKVFRAMDSRGL